MACREAPTLHFKAPLLYILKFSCANRGSTNGRVGMNGSATKWRVVYWAGLNWEKQTWNTIFNSNGIKEQRIQCCHSTLVQTHLSFFMANPAMENIDAPLVRHGFCAWFGVYGFEYFLIHLLACSLTRSLSRSFFALILMLHVRCGSILMLYRDAHANRHQQKTRRS